MEAARASGTALSDTPRLYRRATHKVFGGVAGGLADHLGISPARARVVFVILALAEWARRRPIRRVLDRAVDRAGSPRRSRFDWLAYIAGTVMSVGALFAVAQAMPLGRLFIPSALAIFGGALIWRQASEPQRERWWRLSRSSLGSAGRVGLHAPGARRGARHLGRGRRARPVEPLGNARRAGRGAVTIIGLALLTGPWWMRMVTDLSKERRERIRSQERADLAAHLHDSVLQTLALIQRNAGTPARGVAAGARAGA